MNQGSFINESTENLIRRAQQTLAEIPVLDLTNWNVPNTQIKALAGSCYSITVKNSITTISFSIVTCTGAATTTCTVPGTCPGPLSPTDNVNMVVSFTAAAAQATGATITFQYVLNGTPTTTVLTPGSGGIPAIVAGANTYYAFATNVTYPPDTALVLYGVEILT